MPANPKYLSSARGRIAKISAGILGGFLVTTAIHMTIGSYMNDKTYLVMTAIWSSWILWMGCLLLAFALRRPWISWSIFLGTVLLCVLLFNYK